MRSALYVAGLGLSRVLRPRSGAALAALGLAVAAAVLAGVLGGVTIAADRFTAQAVDRIPASERSVRAVWFGVPAGTGETRPSLDRNVREALPELLGREPIPLVLVRESTVAGRFVGLSGVENVAEHVQLRSGRLPRPCAAERCEVLRLRGRGALPDAPGLRIVEVGTATLVSQQLFGDFLAPTDNALADARLAPALQDSAEYHRPEPAPLVLAEGVDVLASSPALRRTYRSYAWVWPLAGGRPRLWEVDGLVSRVEGARAELASVSSAFAIDAPDEELREAERRAEVAGRRLLLVGGEAAALLLAFALLAARGMRRDLQAARTRLTWHGARRWQLGVLTGVESAVVAVGGVTAGWLVGIAGGAVAARLASAPVGAVVRESTLSGTGLLVAVCAGVLAAALVGLVVSLRQRDDARLGLPELVAGAAALVVGVALLSGAVDDDRLAQDDGAAALLLLLPGLVALVAAIVVARLVRPLARFVAGRSQRRLPMRLAALGLARSPGAAVAAVSFLTIAFGLALLAEAYRATLVRGEHDAAAFEAPHDVVVREDLSALVRVFEAAPLGRFQELAGPEGAAYPVLRLSAAAERAEQVTGVDVLGLDGDAVRGLGVWRDGWAGGATRDELAARIDPGDPVALAGVALNDGRSSLAIGPGLIGLAALVETPGGDFRRLELGRAQSSGTATLALRAPPGSLLVSLDVLPPPRLIEGGADAGQAFSGSVSLGGEIGRALRGWTGVDGAEVSHRPDGVQVRFVLTPQRRTRLRAPQATDAEPPAVLATRRLAELAGGVGGTLPLRVSGGVARVRVAGILERFPTTSGDAVVGDRGALRTAINSASPGAARENELWLDVDGPPERALAGLERPPYEPLAVTARSSLEREARRDPLARGTLLALGAAALAALVLAALGLALAVKADLRDDRGELVELEAQGAAPSLLRRVVRSRALAMSAAGLAAGVLTGLALVGLVTRVVSVTARGELAEPPLEATVDPVVVAVGIVLFGLLALALVGVTTRNAFAGVRGPLAEEHRP